MENSLTLGSSKKSLILSTGLAIFAMFFGAGNIVFPLALGKFAQDKNVFAIMGLILTAVFVPLIGLLSMLLFKGNYHTFFKRIGNLPGFIIILVILAVIGPFGGIPRCITISYSTLNAFGVEGGKGVSLFSFSLFSCAIIFLFAFRPNHLLKLLGYVLTPVLLLSLLVIVVSGLWDMPLAESSSLSSASAFAHGFLEGYNTMDLLAAFFFSSVVLLCLQRGLQVDQVDLHQRRFFLISMRASLIAAALLALVYICFSWLAAGYSGALQDVPNHKMLGFLAFKLLGPYAGLMASVSVTFACLTTEIALTAIFAQFLQENLFKKKISYSVSLGLTLGTSLLISTLHFDGITAFLGPFLQICYPALIVLSVLNILYKLYGFTPVKRLFYSTIGITLFFKMIT